MGPSWRPALAASAVRRLAYGCGLACGGPRPYALPPLSAVSGRGAAGMCGRGRLRGTGPSCSRRCCRGGGGPDAPSKHRVQNHII